MGFKKGQRRPGRPSRLSQAATRTPTPVVKDDVSDEEMVDGDDGVDVEREATPQDDVDEEEVVATPGGDDDEDEDADSPPTVTTIPRRRRGRGGARQSTRGRDTPDTGADDASESGTPFRRRRGRPPGTGSGRGGFRGRRKGAPPEAPHVMWEGQKIDVINDEAQIDYDAEGEEKVDEDGNLLGGREYRVRTFTIAGRGERLYMLSTEPARCCGFRDSYLFFTKHPKLYKVLIGDAEKKDLIDRDVLPNSYKGRNIGVVTARSVFREFGARIIVGGKKVIDDYKVEDARANGDVEGELADPDDRLPGKDEEYNRNRYVAWFGASDVYRSQGGVSQPTTKPGPVGKRRNNITIENWQSMHSKEAGNFNSTLAAMRRSTLNGVYDAHTNMMFYPKIMQPTHVRWEQTTPPDTRGNAVTMSNGTHLTNGNGNHIQTNTTFKPVPAVVLRNFAVIDTVYTAPPITGAGFPGPDDAITDPTAGTTGLGGIPKELVDELPSECRQAFERARAMETPWKRQWGTEQHSGLRGDLRIGFNGYPV